VGDDDARWWGYDNGNCAGALSAGLGWVEVALRWALEEREGGSGAYCLDAILEDRGIFLARIS
jgi:hypothetical protein